MDRPGRKPKPATEPTSYNRVARTVASRLNKLRVIWSKWFITELEFCRENPWEEVAPPKLDRLAPRYLTAEEVAAFFAWLIERWENWRLPILFFTVKGFLGNRIRELCALRTEQLREGRVVFAADATKGRKEPLCHFAPGGLCRVESPGRTNLGLGTFPRPASAASGCSGQAKPQGQPRVLCRPVEVVDSGRVG